MIRSILIKKRFWAGGILAQFLLFYIASKTPAAVRLCELLFEKQKSIHQKIFAGFPFSVGDVLYICIGFLIILTLVRLSKKQSRKNATLSLLIIINIIYFVYQIFWGMLYFQTPLLAKLSSEPPTSSETKALALHYLQLAKASREKVEEDREGVFRLNNLHSVEQAVLTGQTRIPTEISLKRTTGIHSFKPSLFRLFMSDTGILGYYNPFTSEAQYNPQLPATYLPFTLAHESAHQLGFAREQEANFVGFLMGENSNNTDLRYSTEYFALKSLLRNIATQDSLFVKEVVNQYSDGMKRDRLFEKKFAEEHSGLLTSFFGFTNNLFLKSNRQEGSITYSYFTDLLIRYERTK